MCAINGITAPAAIRRVEKMNSITARRGPEGSHIWSDGKITLGHNLLATMGQLSTSKQPMHYKESSIVFNGAIFNWKDIDEWDSQVDTQVLLKGLHEYGINFLDKCEGMWAFAWYKDNELVLCRDRFGIKPLLYRTTEEGLIFSSSPHALESKDNVLDTFAFSMYRDYGYVPGYLTLLKDVHKLVPGEVITYNFNNKKIAKSSIWKKQFTVTDWDPQEFVHRLATAVTHSSNTSRQRGVFLSGGLDSASVMHFLKEKKTYTTSYEPCASGMFNDDARCAALLADDYELYHTQVAITQQDFLLNIKETVKALELPTYNRNNPSYLMINRFMRNQGTIITYSGDGGDEMYTGYCVHGNYRGDGNDCPFAGHHRAIAWKGGNRLQLHKKCDYESIGEYCKYMESWFPTQIFGDDFLNNCLAVEMLTRVSEDYLARNDRLGAYYGMEGRFPLLNTDFYYYVMGISSKIKVMNKDPGRYAAGEYKYLARQGLKDILPSYIVNKKKTGWSVPYAQWSASSISCGPIDDDINGLINWKSAPPKIKFPLIYFKEWLNMHSVRL
ncbi:hypothetical protein H8E06_01360 [bacterium]|nr:hypothetical protein [bacterium]